MEAGDRPRAADDQEPAAPRHRARAGLAGAWLVAIVALSATATLNPGLVLQWTRILPGRDKTGHFLLMGGFAAVSVIAFASPRLGDRRYSTRAVLAVVAVLVTLEEFVQLWLPHRTFSIGDLASSLAGVACFGALAAARYRVARGKR
jgi:VanZ family protein